MEKIKLQSNVIIEKKMPGGTPFPVKIVCYIVTTFASMTALMPMILMIIVSFTDDDTLTRNGYSFFPEQWSMAAYKYLFKTGEQIFHSYFVTITITVVGTLLGILIMTMFAYAVTRKSFPWRNQFVFFIYFTMLFSGGLVPTYMMMTNVLGLRDNIWALILPLCVNGTYILILRTYMRTSVPESVVESAKIDGAGDFFCYYKIVLPMCIPVIATIALFLAVGYWNDWYQAFLYVLKNDNIVPIQLLLKRIENNIQYLSNASKTGMSAVEIQQLSESLPKENVRMALVVLVVVPIMVSYPFFQQFFINGITVGAVKE